MTHVLTGRVRRDAIGTIEIPRLSDEILNGYRGLPDLTGIVSDALDLCFLPGAVAGTTLRPSDPSARVVAQAITLLNRRRGDEVAAAVRARDNRLGDIEAHNLAQPGDVLVIQGAEGISSMGGISAAIGKRQGEVGAIVDGAVRDVDSSRAIGYPTWSRSISPVSGKWRLETVGVNVRVSIAGVTVDPGDLVIADEIGVCFVPFAHAQDVLTAAQQIASREDERVARIAAGASLVELAKG